MTKLIDDIQRAFITIHRKTGKEYIHLSEIYSEVERIRNKPNANKGASIRGAIETHRPGKTVSKQNQLFIPKEIGSGYWKSIAYDNLNIINELEIGEILTEEQLMKIFRVSGQRGMLKSNSTYSLSLIVSEDNDIYSDSSIRDGKIIYTGEGRIGDQKLEGNNYSLAHSEELELPVYLFTKNKDKKYIFEGRVYLDDKPYQTDEKDKLKNIRKVWKFPLAIDLDDSYIYKKDSSFNNIVKTVELLEDQIDIPDDNELIFEDGPLLIRKYNEYIEKRKGKRNKKPNYVAETIIKNKQGEINEERVFNHEVKRLLVEEAFEQVDMMIEFFKNRKDNEGYDILSFEKLDNGDYKEKYIEVKSTKGNERTPIDITSNELDFAKKHKNNYYIYRVILCDTKNRYVKIITGEKLLLDYKLIPTSYKIYSN